MKKAWRENTGPSVVVRRVDGGRSRAHPCQADEQAPDETMFALVPDGHAEQWIGREPVDTYEDVRGREAKTEAGQGRGGSSGRTRALGHFGRKIQIYSIFLFLENGFFFLFLS